ncbi:MAG: hypothetical protein Q9225_006308 [Loekoesia sp. 1 TL-2023]
MSWTRLLHAPSCELKKFPIHELSPFIAISHTWSDALFRPGVPFPQQPGFKAINCLLSQCFPTVEYCWIDTLCIDQNDADDKKRQIPLMGDIYSKAVAVAIIFKTPIGLTQERLDRVTRSVEGALNMYREESWKEEGQKWELGQQRRRCLKEAMDCLELFTRSPWATRVWTLQEFVLAKATVWIGEDLIPLKINEELFVALPDVCETLNISECIMGRYGVLYQYYRGMAGARLKMIDRTRVMELLGNRTATEAVDEVFGTMAASGVVIEEIDVESKEEAWRLWWEKAVREGHVRWSLLPPTSPPPGDYSFNCAMPPFSTRHQASSSSGLDTVNPLGPVNVDDGVVTMAGRWVGVCKLIRRLGRVHQDANGLLHRDITLILFASNNWSRALRIARAFGGGRYTSKKISIIAQVLKHNFYRAQLAVMSRREGDFRPRFRNQYYQYIWSDFMLLQSVHMMVMNEGVAFLAELHNEKCSADIVMVMGTNEQLSGNLVALDFGAKNTSGRTLLAVVEVTDDHLNGTNTQKEAPSLHKVGMTAAVEITDPVNAKKYSAVAFSDSDLYNFSMGGRKCIRCRSSQHASEEGEGVQVPEAEPLQGLTLDQKRRRLLKLKMRKQNYAFKRANRREGFFSGIRKRRRERLTVRRGTGS